MKLHIHATNPDGKTMEVTWLCRSISWRGDYRNVSRTLSFSPVTSDHDPAFAVAPTELGGSVQMFWGDELLMDAFSMERSRDSISHTIDVVAYDRGLYLKRCHKFMRVEGQTPEGVTAALCSEFGIRVGSLAQTGVPVTCNFLGVDLYSIIMTLYTLAADTTHKKYRIRFCGAELQVVEMAQNDRSILLRPGSNLLSCVTKESASGMTNSVAIYDDNFNLQSVREDRAGVRLYGLMQGAIKASAYNDPEGHADKLLRENGLQTTITLNALGNPKLITGNTVVIQEPVTNTYGLFWIVSDTHTWKNGVYRTKISVSFQSLMDSRTVGSMPTT